MHKIHMKLLYLVHKNIKNDRKNLPAQERARDICTPLPFFFVCKK